MKEKIAVCIPTLNEASTIVDTLTRIDRGLHKYFKEYENFIVNADNNSKDKTKFNFFDTPTDSRKIYIGTGNYGKGNNLLSFFNFCKENNINYAATIDSDVKTVEPEWVKKLIDPLTAGDADYVTPVYERNRFEGSTTNHFAFPMIFAFFGDCVRQPIAGDFAFNKKYINHVLAKKILKSTRDYGIDIFMTIHALGGGFSIKEVNLGKKIHSPSFTKIEFMPQQVIESGLEAISQYEPRNYNHKIVKIKTKRCIHPSRKFSHAEKAKKLLNGCLKNLELNQQRFEKIIPGSQAEINYLLNFGNAGNDSWPFLLCKAIDQTRKKSNYKAISLVLAQISLARTIIIWLKSRKLSANEVENEIARQAISTRRYIRSH
ncbi:MAG: glycosyltransferase [Candidatus Berkelbacteria bacterium]|nr:glycosyltransferase [Candidatus Berkelbacteria bacterium]